MIHFVGTPELFEDNAFKLSTIEECKAWLDNLTEVGLDIESEGDFDFKNKMVMLQLYSPTDDKTFVIDTRQVSILPLKAKLETITCLGQNLKFDYKFLKHLGVELDYIWDCMLAEACLTNGLTDRKLGLAAIADKYLGMKLDKSVRNQFTELNGQPFTLNQIVYGEGDVKCLFGIREKQMTQIKDLGIENWVDNEMKACLALADIEYNGMGFDKAKWLELAKKAKANVATFSDELDELVRQEPKLNGYVLEKVQGNLFAGFEDGYEHSRDIDIKWSSPKQMSKVFKDLGLDLKSTSERFLVKYQNTYPLVKKFIDYKKNQKLITTYGEKFLKYVNPITGRVHTSFWQILDTTRVSSGNKVYPNMQNLPAKAEYRNCFVPREGFKMVDVDFSGQEILLTSQFSGEPLWIDALNNGEDLHSKVASMVFNVPLEEVRDKPPWLRGKSYRDAAKTINFGYGK